MTHSSAKDLSLRISWRKIVQGVWFIASPRYSAYASDTSHLHYRAAKSRRPAAGHHRPRPWWSSMVISKKQWRFKPPSYSAPHRPLPLSYSSSLLLLLLLFLTSRHLFHHHRHHLPSPAVWRHHSVPKSVRAVWRSNMWHENGVARYVNQYASMLLVLCN